MSKNQQNQSESEQEERELLENLAALEARIEKLEKAAEDLKRIEYNIEKNNIILEQLAKEQDILKTDLEAELNKGRVLYNKIILLLANYEEIEVVEIQNAQLLTELLGKNFLDFLDLNIEE